MYTNCTDRNFCCVSLMHHDFFQERYHPSLYAFVSSECKNDESKRCPCALHFHYAFSKHTIQLRDKESSSSRCCIVTNAHTNTPTHQLTNTPIHESYMHYRCGKGGHIKLHSSQCAHTHTHKCIHILLERVRERERGRER